MTQHHYRTLLYKQIASLSLADSAVMIPSLNENPFLNHSLFKKRTTMEGTPYSKIKLGAKPEFMPHYKDIPFLHHTMDYFKDFVKGLKDLPLNKKKSLLIQSLRVLCIFPLHQKSQLYFKIFLNSLSKTFWNNRETN